jgi:hypothetical protein
VADIIARSSMNLHAVAGIDVEVKRARDRRGHLHDNSAQTGNDSRPLTERRAYWGSGF